MKFHKLDSVTKDLGGFTVGRLLPQLHLKHAGPFVFLDHMGPATFAPGKGMDVRPHPHIGLSTVTYLFSGKIHHKDHLGFSQDIAPGDVNWMTAGKGIVHSERTPADLRAKGQDLHGLQMWVALPKDDEDCEPSFHHHPKETLPTWIEQDHSLRLILGQAFRHRSPVKTYSKMFYVDVHPKTNHTLSLEGFLTDQLELKNQLSLAIYPLRGEVEIQAPASIFSKIETLNHSSHPNPRKIGPRQIGCLQIAADEAKEILPQISLKSSPDSGPAHYVLFGGEDFPEERFLFWNFVSSSKDKIEDAKKKWQDQTMGKIEGETEFIPLPS